MVKAYNKLAIKNWSVEDQPRERMMRKGRQSLTDVELIAILLNSGNREETAVSLARRLLEQVNNDLHRLGRMPLDELKQFKGIGTAKAVRVAAALELGLRRQMSSHTKIKGVGSSADAWKMIAPQIMDLPHEEFWVLLLNRAHRLISKELISIGGVSGTVVDGKLIFRHAITQLASSIILCHNHPSGNLQPSRADIDITRKLKEGGKQLDVNVVDHLIVTSTGYFSFADEGLL
ncbi:MAG: DNA repair protein RadC [Bacteroidota bacterium]